ncbi:MAG: MarR family transcriptional regulator [Candidatus Methanomethylophilaceae archaeon]|nr:MarR family transcriptional regulator [Candidatus Methanomethylophilaceae archaeon]
MNSKKTTTKRTRTRVFKLIAGVLAVSGLVLAAIGFLTPQTIGSTNGQVMAYTTLNMLLSLGGGPMFAAGTYALVGGGGESNVEAKPRHEMPAATAPEAVTAGLGVADERVESSPPLREGLREDTYATADTPQEAEPVETPERGPPVGTDTTDGTDGKEEGRLVLRLLSGDDRMVFRTIMEAGGEILQKDIVNKTKMSDAKVSRTLDRLEEKGVIVKERHGMSNKVRIEVER